MTDYNAIINQLLKGLPEDKREEIRKLMSESEKDPLSALKNVHRSLGDMIARIEKKREP